MTKLLSFSKISFKEALSYKFEVFLWMVAVPVGLAVYYFLWKSIYSYTGQEVIRGFTLSELLSYFVLIEIVAYIVWSNADQRLARKVYTGDLVVPLVRPVKIYFNYLFHRFGRLLFFIPINTTIFAFIGIYFFDMKAASLAHIGLFVLSIFLSIMLVYSFVFLLGISAFWLKDFTGLHLIKQGIIWLVGGGLAPLVFFPKLAQQILALLPFQYMLYAPAQIFLGNFTMTEIYQVLAIQVIWTVLLCVFIHFAWKKAMLKFSGVGA